MAQGERTCDACGKPTKRIVAKVLLVPIKNGEKWRERTYTAHADIGECCAARLSEGGIVKWTTRKKQKAA